MAREREPVEEKRRNIKPDKQCQMSCRRSEEWGYVGSRHMPSQVGTKVTVNVSIGAWLSCNIGSIVQSGSCRLEWLDRTRRRMIITLSHKFWASNFFFSEVQAQVLEVMKTDNLRSHWSPSHFYFQLPLQNPQSLNVLTFKAHERAERICATKQAIRHWGV